MQDFLLSWRKQEEQVYFQQLHWIIKQSTIAFPKTTTPCPKGKLACVSFPYIISTSALSKTAVRHEGNITHAIFPSIV